MEGPLTLAGVRGCFVTGTDTGVGKTVLTAAIVAALRLAGVRVAPLKPVVTGLDEQPAPGWPHDHQLLARVAAVAPRDVAVFEYGPPVSPHLAARRAGRPIEPGRLLARVAEAARGGATVVVEGVGGLLVPLGPGYDVRALAVDLALPVVIAARPGLGTINHTLLTVEAARGAGLEVAAVVLTPWPETPGEIESSNRETISELANVSVATLPYVPEPAVEALAAAARSLPLHSWLVPALR